MADQRWLQQRGRAYYCVREVPRPLRAALGKRRFVASLHTRDLHVAIARRHSALAAFEQEIARATAKTASSPLIEAGMEWRKVLAKIDRGDSGQLQGFGSGLPVAEWDPECGEVTRTLQERARQGAETVLFEEADRIHQEHGREAAERFLGVAQGTTTPLLHHVDAWLAEGGAKGTLADRTKRQYRSDLEALEAWAKGAGVPPVIEASTKAVVGRFVGETMVAAGANRKTSNRKITAASSYWRWLGKRTGAESNPWTGQSLSKVARRDGPDTKPRPFTDDELETLLAGDTDDELADAMRIAALSGMRIEEIYRLTVANCADGWFNITRSKTEAGVRQVPIHPDIAGIVTRRTKGQRPDAYLFPEAGPLRPGRERSMPASKRFGHYRQRLGVDDRRTGSGNPASTSIASDGGSSPRPNKPDSPSPLYRWSLGTSAPASRLASTVVAHRETSGLTAWRP